MASVYIICLIVGGGLLLLSTFFSGHQSDFSLDHASPDVDLDAGSNLGHDVPSDAHVGDHGHAHDSSLSLATWISIQFLIYFVAVFGLVGTTLTFGSNMLPGWVLGSALVAGLLVGQLVHQCMRFLKKTGRGSEISSTDFVEKLARVTINIDPPRHGEVAVPLHSGERFVSAVAKRPHDKFRVGDRVVVTSFHNGVAEVVSKEEYEFVSGKNSSA